MDVIEPTDQGLVDRDGVGIAWERYGSGEAAVTFPPVFNIAHSRLWKAQVPWLARHARVLAIDPRGNGRSDRPSEPEQFDPSVVTGDIVASLDAAGIERTVLVGNSYGSLYSILVAGLHPERVAGIVHIGPAINLTGEHRRSHEPGAAVVRRRARRRRGLGDVQPPRLPAGLAPGRSVLHRPGDERRPLETPDRGRPRAGRSRPIPRRPRP